jgi:hypothetical protein
VKLGVVGTLGAVVCVLARPASGQIISTMVPTETSTPTPAAPGGGPKSAWHIMGGFANWSFGTDALNEQTVAGVATLSGGHNGFIVAADFAVRAGGNMSVGGGAWFNKVTDFKAHFPNFADLTATRSYSSVYGNVFYKMVGVQAGVIPQRGENEVVFTPSSGFASQSFSGVSNGHTDFAVFGVGRFGSKPGQRRWSSMTGAGLYHFGSRQNANSAGNAFSIFLNGSIGVYKRFSIDASIWFTTHDQNFSAENFTGNERQTRFTIGIGFGS